MYQISYFVGGMVTVPNILYTMIMLTVGKSRFVDDVAIKPVFLSVVAHVVGSPIRKAELQPQNEKVR